MSIATRLDLVCCVHVNRFENLAYGLASEAKPNRVIVALALWEDSVSECATTCSVYPPTYGYSSP